MGSAKTTRIISTTVQDQTTLNPSNMVFSTITITAVNDAPVVDLNAGGAGQDVTTAFTEQTPVLIAPVGTLTDVDSANLTALTVTLTTRPDGNAGGVALAISNGAMTGANGTVPAGWTETDPGNIASVQTNRYTWRETAPATTHRFRRHCLCRPTR